MLLYAGWSSMVIAAVVGVLASPAVGAIPGSIGHLIGWPSLVLAIVLIKLQSYATRRRNRDRYWNAGFIVEPRDLGQEIDDFLPFHLNGRGSTTDCFYWLPEAPEVRIYDLLYDWEGPTRGHVVTLPTSASDGVAARGFSEKVVAGSVRVPGPLVTDARGVVRSSGKQVDELVLALPLWPGILVVRFGRARWLTRETLATNDIKNVIGCLQRLPPPGGDWAASPQTTGSDRRSM